HFRQTRAYFFSSIGHDRLSCTTCRSCRSWETRRVVCPRRSGYSFWSLPLCPLNPLLSCVQLPHALGLPIARSDFCVLEFADVLVQRLNNNQGSAAGFDCADLAIANEPVDCSDTTADHGCSLWDRAEDRRQWCLTYCGFMHC